MAKTTDAEKISEALELLEEVAKDKKDELQSLISDKYHGLKSVLGDVAEGLKKQGRDTIEHGLDKVKDLVSKSDENVHHHPWPYLGGTALGFLILGIFLGRSGK